LTATTDTQQENCCNCWL